MTSRRAPSAASEELVGWQQVVGFGPHKVLVFENLKRKRVLYLRWRRGGNWAYESLQAKLYDDRGRRLTGRALVDAKEAALAAADARYQRNKGAFVEEPAAELPPAPLTLLQGLAKAIDKKTGKYPTDTDHRREVVREITWSAMILRTSAGDATWESLTRASFTTLWRTRFTQLHAEGKQGLRSAEKTIARVIAVATWLRDVEEIPPGAAVPPSKWKEMLRADYATIVGGGELPDVKQPRHTLEESRRILAAAAQVDPRLDLLLSLGAELRAGQVRRRRRSDLVLPPIDWDAISAMTADERRALDYGTFRVRSSGKKGGAVVDLTRGQRFAVDVALRGYLRTLEAEYQRAQIDYPLFTSHRLVRDEDGTMVAPLARRDASPLQPKTALRWFKAAEELAKVESIPGRVFYGLRRVSVDDATDQKISAGALQQLGGWSNITTPLGIYKDQASVRDRREARDARARMRGEED